jgi:hypothetical protein
MKQAVAAGIGKDSHGYVIDHLSGRYGPPE